jgi:hypothetical protein
LVVDGIPKSKDGQEGDNYGRSRRILAIKVAGLDSANGRFRRGTLWELGIECDEGSQVGALSRRLKDVYRRFSCKGVKVKTHEDGRGGDFGGYEAR